MMRTPGLSGALPVLQAVAFPPFSFTLGDKRSIL